MVRVQQELPSPLRTAYSQSDMHSQRSKFRSVFTVEEEDPAWKKAISQFPNGVPRFESKDEAIEFTKQHCTVGSNPDTPHLLQSITTLISWEQICTHLIPRIKKYDTKWPAVDPTASCIADNRFTKPKDEGNESKEDLLYDYMNSRLDLSIHKEMSMQSTLNTLKYMFFHMKCGIFVMIRNNRVVTFCPFVNKDYKNSWGGALKVGSSDGTIGTYYDEKRNHYKKEDYLPDVDEWWANGNIICNVYSNEALGNQFWGDHFLLQVKDMFAETCNQRTVPDCQFFVNKRDYPHLKFNPDIAGGIPVEPYGFIFDRDDRVPEQDLPLNRHFYKSYAPILLTPLYYMRMYRSFYSSKRFADVPIPPTEDWEAATGMVFPSSFVYSLSEAGEVTVSTPRDLFTAANLKKFDTPWADKVNTAFFRGTATGGGVTAETNQRIHLAQLCHEWSHDPALNGKQAEGAVPFLDAKITGWNLRDKKIASRPMTHIHPKDFPFSGDKATNFVPIYKQSSFKYLIYAEGHCAACRYGFMMQLGSVILKVESQCVADQMWYFPLLRPYYDHIPVKADLSDLRQVLEWCHSHDEECQQIAAHAKEVYDKYVSRDGILDYLQALCVEVSRRTRRTCPEWCGPAPEERAVPCIAGRTALGPPQSRFCTENRDGEYHCSYCQALIAQEEEARRLSILNRDQASSSLKRAATSDADYKKQQAKALKNRMKQKADELKQAYSTA